MARQTIIEILDDLDGSPAESSVTFGVDGAMYEIDLSAANHERFVAAMAPYVAVAQMVGKSGGIRAGVARVSRRVAAQGAMSADLRKELNTSIRSWFNGLTEAERTALELPASLSDRGRIPEDIRQSYAVRNNPTVKATVKEAETAVEATGEVPATPAKARTRKSPAVKVAQPEINPVRKGRSTNLKAKAGPDATVDAKTAK